MTYKLYDDADYYEDRPVPHTAQGDLYAAVPFTRAVPLHLDGQERGARKRPAAFGDDHPDFTELTHPMNALGLVCNYTCNFVAQPPGTAGYAHPFRLVAPVVPLSVMVSRHGLAKNEARRIVESGGVAGLMYLPAPPDWKAPNGALTDPAPASATSEGSPQDGSGEFTGAFVACLYRMASVDQGLLDQRPRIARLSQPAQQILISRLIQAVSPNFPDPSDPNLFEPDMSNSWSTEDV